MNLSVVCNLPASMYAFDLEIDLKFSRHNAQHTQVGEINDLFSICFTLKWVFCHSTRGTRRPVFIRDLSHFRPRKVIISSSLFAESLHWNETPFEHWSNWGNNTQWHGTANIYILKWYSTNLNKSHFISHFIQISNKCIWIEAYARFHFDMCQFVDILCVCVCEGVRERVLNSSTHPYPCICNKFCFHLAALSLPNFTTSTSILPRTYALDTPEL